MQKSLRVFSLIMLVALTAIVACGFSFGCAAREAYAAGNFKFIISAKAAPDGADYGYDWTLTCKTDEGEEVLARAQYAYFIDPDNRNTDVVPGAVFVEKIRDYLSKSGQSEPYTNFDVTFDLPKFSSSISENRVTGYSETGTADIGLSAEVPNMINANQGETDANAKLSLQYKVGLDGVYRTQNGGQTEGDTLYFGAGVPVGVYYVRYAAMTEVYLNINMEPEAPKKCEVYQYGEDFECEIVKSPAPVPDVDRVITATYGTIISSTYSLIEPRPRNGQFEAYDDSYSGDDLLTVGEYTVKYRFNSYNENYTPSEAVSFTLRIVPREVTVYVGNVSSHKGEPCRDLEKEVAVSVSALSLIGEDTQEDLGMQLFVRNFDKDKAGIYFIDVSFSNPNYTPVVQNAEGSPVPYGVYRVFEYRYDVVATDGKKFIVCCDNIEGVEVAIVANPVSDEIIGVDGENGRIGLRAMASYTVMFWRLEERVTPPEAYSVEWVDPMDGAIAYSLYDSSGESDGRDLQPLLSGVNTLTIPAYLDSFILYAEDKLPVVENVWQWYNILLISLCGSLALAAAFTLAAAARRRRRVW